MPAAAGHPLRSLLSGLFSNNADSNSARQSKASKKEAKKEAKNECSSTPPSPPPPENGPPPVKQEHHEESKNTVSDLKSSLDKFDQQLQSTAKPQPAPAPSSAMRRNESQPANMHKTGMALAGTSEFASKRNTSYNTLSELRKLEKQLAPAATEANRKTVIDAVVLQLLHYMLGKEQAVLEMRAAVGIAVAPAAEASGAADEQKLPPGTAKTMVTFVTTIVRQLDLPNSCILAALTYMKRAADDSSFKLSLANWQPSLLAAFVVSAKLSFDEPVWNEDFVKALRISNVQVSQISRWEADFLKLINYNTNVAVHEYATNCFELQQNHVAVFGSQCHFFCYLMEQAKEAESKKNQR